MTDSEWFTEARFGLFVHWGLYSVAARHEWVMSREEIPADEYKKYLLHFDPDRYDPRAWAAAALAAGMKYVVLTTKHHEGFCLWDSKLTDFTVMHTPYGRDLIRPYVDALREAGLRVGFYHSLLDWHHPDYVIDENHPLRNSPRLAELQLLRDPAAYREYLHGQVRELLTDYGTIDYLFFDFSFEGTLAWEGQSKGADDWGSVELLDMVRELQPGIIVNDRLGIPGDFVTPEQYQPSEPMMVNGQSVRWEACQTLNGSWGYDRDNLEYKSTDLLIRMLVDTVSKDGNLLLNVGPTARGQFDAHAEHALNGLARWMSSNERSIHGAGASRFAPPVDSRYTQRGDRLYVHLFAWPFGHLHLPGLADLVDYAQLLDDGSEIRIARIDSEAQANMIHPGGQPVGTLTLELPVHPPSSVVPVIELFLREGWEAPSMGPTARR